MLFYAAALQTLNYDWDTLGCTFGRGWEEFGIRPPGNSMHLGWWASGSAWS